MLLWMEDNENQTIDIKNLLHRLNQPTKHFFNPAQFTNYLIELKEKGHLKEVHLILDIMVLGTPIVMSPKEWNGEKNKYYPADNGYKAGLVFYERVILEDAADFWKPLPGVIFLSVLSPGHDLIVSAIDLIRKKAMELDTTLPDRINFLSKQDSELEKKIKFALNDKYCKHITR